MPSAVGIRSTFSVHGEVVHRFQSEPKASPDERPGSAGGGAKSELQEEAMEVDEKFDHRYTGRHDHGLLPALKSGGPHGDLVQALLDAKEDSNAFLTGLITEEQSKRGAQDQTMGLPKPGSEDSRKDTTTPVTNCKGVESASHTEEQLPAPPMTQPAKRPRP